MKSNEEIETQTCTECQSKIFAHEIEVIGDYIEIEIGGYCTNEKCKRFKIPIK